MLFNNPDPEQDLINRRSCRFYSGENMPPGKPEDESKFRWGIEHPRVPPVCSSQSHTEYGSYRHDLLDEFIRVRRRSNSQHYTSVGIHDGFSRFFSDKLHPQNLINWLDRLLKYLGCQKSITFSPTFVLPTEAVNTVINMLDIESAFRFSCASKLTRQTVTNIPEYKELVQYASKPLGGLKARGAIGLHSIRQLSATLHSQQCAYCTEYGAFIFIVTAERCCFLCLEENPSLALICFEDAVRFFGVMEEDFDTLPSINILTLSARLIPLASARMVKELYVKEWGCGWPEPIFHWDPYWTPYMRAPLSNHSTNEDLLRRPKPMEQPSKERHALKYFHFPSLGPDGAVENGIWCQACKVASRNHFNRPCKLSAFVPEGYDQIRYFRGMSERARSKAGFLDHIKDCEKLREMEEKWWMR